jgi:hypothetical protein
VFPLIASGGNSSQWEKISPGLYRRSFARNGFKVVEFRSMDTVSRQKLALFLEHRHPREAAFLMNLNSGAHFIRAQSASCSGYGDGFPTKAEVSVTCSSNLGITAEINVNPAPSSNGPKPVSRDYTGDTSLFEVLVSTAKCQDQCEPPLDPDDWYDTESWEASDGESGYYCTAGSDAPPC